MSAARYFLNAPDFDTNEPLEFLDDFLATSDQPALGSSIEEAHANQLEWLADNGIEGGLPADHAVYRITVERVEDTDAQG